MTPRPPAASIDVAWRGRELRLEAPRSLFAAAGLDPGSRTLLEHLPAAPPRTFLDLGCGYGALGLAVAAWQPQSHGLLVDRDLLAVDAALRNASALGLTGVEVRPSLGLDGVPPASGTFDWILLNAPARAGDRALGGLLAAACGRLAPGGAVHLVIIAPLAAAVRRLAIELGLAAAQIAATAQHVVFAVRGPAAEPAAAPDLEVYQRDVIDFSCPGLAAPLRLQRPTDLADEPHRLAAAIPLLWECLPAAAPARILSSRAGYGLVPSLLRARYPQAAIAAVDRDLLACAFTRRNLAGSAPAVRVRELLAPAPADELFDLVTVELLLPLGLEGCRAELLELRQRLAPGGTLLAAGLAKQWREGLRDGGAGIGLERKAVRGAAAVYEAGG